VIILTGVVIFWASDNNVGFGIIAVLLMVFASSRFFFRTYYYADETGVGEKFVGYHRTRKWSEFKRVDIGEKAVFLSPFEKPRRLEHYRGWFVPTPTAEIKDFIVKKVRQGITEAVDKDTKKEETE